MTEKIIAEMETAINQIKHMSFDDAVFFLDRKGIEVVIRPKDSWSFTLEAVRTGDAVRIDDMYNDFINEYKKLKV